MSKPQPPNPIAPSSISSPLIAPTTAESWSAPFRVAPELAAGGVNPFANQPTIVTLYITAPNGESIPSGAYVTIHRIDSQANLNITDNVDSGYGFTVVAGDWIAYKPPSEQPYGLDAIGYSAQSSESS